MTPPDLVGSACTPLLFGVTGRMHERPRSNPPRKSIVYNMYSVAFPQQTRSVTPQHSDVASPLPPFPTHITASTRMKKKTLLQLSRFSHSSRSIWSIILTLRRPFPVHCSACSHGYEVACCAGNLYSSFLTACKRLSIVRAKDSP